MIGHGVTICNYKIWAAYLFTISSSVVRILAVLSLTAPKELEVEISESVLVLWPFTNSL